MKYCFINLACGQVFIDNCNWINFDYVNSSESVKKANLLKRLPIKQEIADLVYSSHFLEHIPRPKVNDFLNEILRILKPGGVVRFVLPDLENMANSYVNLRKQGDHQKADFLVLEMIDQCVRITGGGELGVFFSKIKSNPDQYKFMSEFVRERTGDDLTLSSFKQKQKYNFVSKNLKSILASIIHRIQKYWIKIVLLALPSAFRDQNISLASIGERHHWIWDFYSLKKILEEVGFLEVKRLSASTSIVKDFPFYPLDIDDEGKPRKGAESMYVEAIKPQYLNFK